MWDDWLRAEAIKISDIPREARLCFTLYACLGDGGGALGRLTKFFVGSSSETVTLGWANLSWVDFRGLLRRGPHCLPLWPQSPGAPAHHYALSTCAPNPDPQAPTLVIEFDSTSPLPIAFPSMPAITTAVDSLDQLLSKEPSLQERLLLQQIEKKGYSYLLLLT